VASVALITGGTRGIGFGISKALAREGFDLAINGVRQERRVQDAKDELQNLGAEVIYCRADVSSRQQRDRMIDQIRGQFGRLDVLVNNAGVAPSERADVLEASEESFQRLIDINLKGPYFLTQSVANWMIEQKGEVDEFSGYIVNISSISATIASPDRGDYCISKAGISMATKLWAVRMSAFDIPVYEVRPGIIDTDMTAGVTDKYDRLIFEEGLTLQERWGQPGDVGKAVASLLRGDFDYSTGEVFMVDGGMTVSRL
jgi:NAD(P)-dependent dehydrogenase (short-subunit alcohol dehydrogenase family)